MISTSRQSPLTAAEMMSYDKHMQKESAVHFREMAGAVLREGSQLSFRAGGRSMSPFIRDNDRVIIEPLTGTLRIGDVILFASSGPQLLLHRIVKKTADGYVTRGDATLHDDCSVTHREVLGKAVHVVGGLNFHLRFPLSTFVAFALRLREYPVIFSILRIPGRLMLRSLQRSNRIRDLLGHKD